MAQVQIMIGGRQYRVSCRDGGEAHLLGLAAHVDRKAAEVTGSMGSLEESRQLLYASLLLADEIADMRQLAEAAPPPVADPSAVEALERLADRVESLASGLEEQAESA